MKLIFGLQLDNASLPRPDLEMGVHYVGPKGLLGLFESWYGLSGHPNDIEYLRVEQYRQALIHHSATNAAPAFYQKSFEADHFTTAAEMLCRRDELLLAGWDFQSPNGTPPRLATIAAIEQILRENVGGLHLTAGYADRFVAVLQAIGNHKAPLTEIRVNEPLHLLPCHFQQFFETIKKQTNLEIQQLALPLQPLDAQTDLHRFQQRISGDRSPTEKPI